MCVEYQHKVETPDLAVGESCSAYISWENGARAGFSGSKDMGRLAWSATSHARGILVMVEPT
jgi:hypothetical protein